MTELKKLYNDFKKRCSKYTDNLLVKSINHVDDYVLSGYSPYGTMLHISVRYEYNDFIERCISLGAEIDKPNEYGNSALTVSINNNKLEVAELLLKAGANPNNKVDNTCYVIAMIGSHDYEKVLNLLIKYGVFLLNGNTLEIREYLKIWQSFCRNEQSIK